MRRRLPATRKRLAHSEGGDFKEAIGMLFLWAIYLTLAEAYSVQFHI
jgi:hypothetical protein